MKKINLLLLLLLVFKLCYPQGEANNWYFGYHAGVTWNTLQSNGNPMYLMDGELATSEGVATISDNTGNLLFYTDGSTVWNAIHQPMTNSLPSSPGGSLTGNSSATQSGVIIPKPNDPNTYYIFSVDKYFGPQGLAYSRVDMSANSGLGDIDTLEKNVPLFYQPTEKITAVRHDNGTDIWVITHPGGNNEFWTYLVTDSGVQYLNPVVSTGGAFLSSWASYQGYMKASPAGDMICVANEGQEIWELFKFNNATGQLSDPVTLDYLNNDHCYGVEFSDDGHFLYGSERYSIEIHQWDVSVYDPVAIIASHQIIATTSSTGCGALQLGPDHKIYLARPYTGYLGRINNPSVAGSACNYDDQAVLLGPNTTLARNSMFGLPNFITAFFRSVEFTFQNRCNNDTVFFYIENPQEFDSAYWNFNWPSSNPNYHYSGTEDTVIFMYNTGGIYTVELITLTNNYFDTAYTEIHFSQTPIVDLGPDTILCEDDTLYFDLSFNNQYSINGLSDYYWEANIGGQLYNSTAADYIISEPGTYVVTVLGDSICGNASDILIVDYYQSNINLGADTAFCEGDSILLDATVENSTYLWSTNDTTPVVIVNQPGEYSVTVSNLCGNFGDSILVTVYPIPDVFFNLDTTNFYILDPIVINQNLICNYLWSDGSTDTSLMVLGNYGNYSVTVSNEFGCWDTDSIYYSNEGFSQPFNLKGEIHLYPNPASSVLYVGGLIYGDIIDLYDIVGVKYSVNIVKENTAKISIGGLSKGIYFLLVRRGDHMQVFKVLKE